MAHESSTVQLLAGLPLFSACSDKELKHISNLVVPTSVAAGKVLMVQGQAGVEAFVIASGNADVTIDGTSVATVGPGQILGEMTLLDRTTLRTATVTASTPMELLVLEPRGFSDLIEQHPSVLRRIAVALASRLRAAEASHVH
ncbi:MAG: cyclic nucleotide-binding domain-containing protein [Nocardioides sp.]